MVCVQTMGFIKVQRRIGTRYSAYLASYILPLICVARRAAVAIARERACTRPGYLGLESIGGPRQNTLALESIERREKAAWGAQTASGASLALSICTTQLRARCRFANYKPRRT